MCLNSNALGPPTIESKVKILAVFKLSYTALLLHKKRGTTKCAIAILLMVCYQLSPCQCGVASIVRCYSNLVCMECRHTA